IVYYLTNSKIPTKYVLPNWFIKKEFSRFIGIDIDQELTNILEKKPVYIIVKDSEKYNGNNKFYIRIRNYIENNYFLEKTIDNALLYKRDKENGYAQHSSNDVYEF
ncbi:MAG: hypothetical protein OEU26_29830, partial [Candidatus Tectomicrobia bacterium]|nr:hypothetical protein [Candidatus Tectomicrobia bacterium]